jgi:predicted Zn-dependent protease
MEVRRFCKSSIMGLGLSALVFLSGCSHNPATGRTDFNGLMSPQQEAEIGASQHQEIIKEYGGIYNNPTIQTYVETIGQKMAAVSERRDVTYRFTVLDSPIINAFALPGGYIYITRGTLAAANSEAELAAVLGHEVAHVAARHQASRYSRGVLTQLGAAVLGAAIGSSAATQAIGMGSNLYMSSYSREQESEADALGIRYLAKTGYDLNAMSDFLRTMSLNQSVEASLKGKQEASFSYFSSHPHTPARIQQARAEAGQYQSSPSSSKRNEQTYLTKIRGLTHGESKAQGFVRRGTFFHPDIGFAFSFPDDFTLDNNPKRIVIEGRDGTIMLFDMANNAEGWNASDYIRYGWLKGDTSPPVETFAINGMNASSVQLDGSVKNQPVSVRLIAVEWSPKEFIRMQILIPNTASRAAVDDMKRVTYSLRTLSSRERQNLRPHRIELVKADRSDTAQTLAQEMDVEKLAVEQFLALNGLTPAQPIEAGRLYKVIR